MKRIICGNYKECLNEFVRQINMRKVVDGFVLTDKKDADFSGNTLLRLPCYSNGNLPHESELIYAKSYDGSERVNAIKLDSEGEDLITLSNLYDMIGFAGNRQIILYGYSASVEIVKFLVESLGLTVKQLYERESKLEDGSVFGLSFDDWEDKILLITDTYSEEQHEMINDLGVPVNCFLWLKGYKNVSNFLYSSNRQNKFSIILDPSIGHNASSERDYAQGFLRYSYIADNIRPVRILILGGSTSCGYGIRHKCWAEQLSIILSKYNISHEIINGAVHDYNVSQELVKIIRDGIWTKPDYIISYSGVNNLGKIRNMTKQWGECSPFLRSFQLDLFSSIVGESDKYPTADSKDQFSKGMLPNVNDFEFWFMQERMIYAICNELNIGFKAILQPCAYSLFLGNNTFNELYSKGVISGRGCFYDNNSNSVVQLNENTNDSSIFQSALDFRNEAGKKEDVKWFKDFSAIFDNTPEVYIDFCHLNEQGEIILAEKVFDLLIDELLKVED